MIRSLRVWRLLIFVLIGSTLAVFVADRWSPTSFTDLLNGLMQIIAFFSFWVVVYFAILGLPLLTLLAKKGVSKWLRGLIMGFFAILPVLFEPEINFALLIMLATGILVGAFCVKDPKLQGRS